MSGSHSSHDHSHLDSSNNHDHGHRAAEGDIHASAEKVEAGLGHMTPHVRRGAAKKVEAAANQRKLKAATAFVLIFFVVEVIGGIWSGSLAILSDAAHLLTDVSGFILAMVANEIASRPACDKFTYGPVRAEVLSALFSTATILVLSLFLIYSAIVRIIEFSRGVGEEIDGKMMSSIALLGLLVNLALLGIFGHEHGGHDHGHGHGHGHSNAHDDHDHHDHDDHHDDHDHDEHDDDHDHHDHHDDHDEEEGLVASGDGGAPQRYKKAGVGERSSLVNNNSINSNSNGAVGGGQAPPGALHISISSSTSSILGAGGQDMYGSLVGTDGGPGVGCRREAGVDGFPEVDTKAGVGKEIVKRRKEKNINMEAAVLHAVTDLVQSAGVLLAGLLIWYDPRWKWADPIATLFFVGLVVNSTRWPLKRAFHVLLEGVPDSMNYDQLRDRLSNIEGVIDVHCLHVWSLTLGRTVVSAHIKANNPEKALASAHKICEAMGATHATIQVQVDHCAPESCIHPCVSARCGSEGMRGYQSAPPTHGVLPLSSKAS